MNKVLFYAFTFLCNFLIYYVFSTPLFLIGPVAHLVRALPSYVAQSGVLTTAGSNPVRAVNDHLFQQCHAQSGFASRRSFALFY